MLGAISKSKEAKRDIAHKLRTEKSQKEKAKSADRFADVHKEEKKRKHVERAFSQERALKKQQRGSSDGAAGGGGGKNKKHRV